MVNVDESKIVRFKSHGHSFEIRVDHEGALAFREGKISNVKDVLAVQKIFSDAMRGMEAPSAQVLEAFGTNEIFEVAKMIIKKGDLPLSQAYRANLRDQKKKQILNYIHTNGVDPKTLAPHPMTRIEHAYDEAKIQINENESIEHEIQEAIKKMRPILALKFVIKEIAVVIGSQYAHKSYHILHSYGSVKKEEWMQNGNLKVHIEIPGGLEEEFYSKLNALCHGELQADVIRVI